MAALPELARSGSFRRGQNQTVDEGFSRRRFLAAGLGALAGPGVGALARRGWGRTLAHGSGQGATPAGAAPSAGTTVETLSLDPLQGLPSTYSAAVFDTLVGRDPASGAATAALATSWRRMTPTLAEFVLSPRATFSDGSAVTAADAAFSIETALSLGGPLAAALAGLTRAEASGPVTLRLHTAAPDPLLLVRCAALAVVPRAAYSASPLAFAQSPLGSGYFTVSGFSPGSTLSLRAAGISWKGPPASSAVELRSFATGDALLAALGDGGISLAQDLPLPGAGSLVGLASLAWASAASDCFLLLQTTSGPFADPRLRRAANLAVDPARLAARTLSGAAQPLGGQLVGPGCTGHVAGLAPVGPDPDEARRLLALAGHPHGLRTVLAGPAEQQGVLAALASSFAAVGIHAELELLGEDAWLRAVAGTAGSGSWPMLFAAYQEVPLFDAAPLYERLTSRPPGGGAPSFSDARFDRLVAAQRQELDPGRRAAQLGALAALVRAELPCVFLYRQRFLYGWSPALRGVTLEPGFDLRLDTLSLPPSP